MPTQAATRSRQDLQHARGEPSLRGQRGNANRREGCIGCRFQNNRVARGKRRGEFPGRSRQRKVPRDNSRYHSEGEALHQGETLWPGGCDFIIDLVDGFATPTDRPDGGRYIRTGGVRDGFTHIKTFQQCEFFGVFLNEFRPANQHHLPVCRRHR